MWKNTNMNKEKEGKTIFVVDTPLGVLLMMLSIMTLYAAYFISNGFFNFIAIVFMWSVSKILFRMSIAFLNGIDVDV